MRKEIIIGVSVLAIVIVGWFVYSLTKMQPETKPMDSEMVSIPTENIKVEKPKAQISNMDTSQIDAELEKLNEDSSSDLQVDDIE